MQRAVRYADMVQRMPKLLRTPITKLLHRRLQHDFLQDLGQFKGRSVLILGPARTVEEDLGDVDVASYDLIVRMNNAIAVPIKAEGLSPFRCDILFHSLTDEARGVAEDDLRRANVQLLVHRTAKRSNFLDTLAAAHRFREVCAVKNIPHNLYNNLRQALAGASPTTGLMCARFFLEAPVRKVGLVGFTFFSTAYHQGYDDKVSSDEAAVNRIVSASHHAPHREAALLAELIGEARQAGKIVDVGSNMRAAAVRVAGVEL